MAVTRMMADLPNELLENYFHNLVNQFFKILPMKEDGEPSLEEYMKSLLLELRGCTGIMAELNHDSMFMSLIATLQYLIDNDCETAVVKREVFKCITICKRIAKKYHFEV